MAAVLARPDGDGARLLEKVDLDRDLLGLRVRVRVGVGG